MICIMYLYVYCLNDVCFMMLFYFVNIYYSHLTSYTFAPLTPIRQEEHGTKQKLKAYI